MKTTILALLALLFCKIPVSAQEICAGKTVGDCWDSLTSGTTQAMISVAQDQEADATWDQLTRKATGLDLSEVAPNSAIQDFLPLLRLALVGKGLQSNGDLTALDFDHKIPFNGPLELKLKGARNTPDIYEPLQMKFAEDVRDQEVTKLKNKLGDFDDYSVTLSGNLKTNGFGRSWNDTSRKVFATLFSTLVGGADFKQSDVKLGQLRRIVAEENVTEITPIDQIDPKIRQDLITKLANAASALNRDIAGLKTLAEQRGIFRVADLINNQPQINGSAEYRVRRGPTGPDEFSLKGSWEYGFANLNKMLKTCKDKDSATCYSSYIKDHAGALDHGDRTSISFEYQHHQPFQASLPASGIDLDLPSGKSWDVLFTYGRYIDIKALGKSNSRIDLTGEYQNVSDDPTRQDRLVISATYSNRFLQSLGMSVGVSYANHAEFLPSTDHQVSAHFAVSYRLLPEKPQ